MPETRDRAAWVTVDVRPGEAPEVTRQELLNEDGPEVTYEIYWPSVSIGVTLSGPELQDLIGRAMIAQAGAA